MKSMRTKIIMLVVHILCVATCGACSVNANDTYVEAIYTLCTILWGVIVGLDIADIRE